MDATKCEAFVASTETGSFTAAAKRLGYTQSGVTRMVKSLEAELGFPLFRRISRGVAPTADGEAMLPLMRDVVRSERAAEQMGSSIRGVETGSVAVGCYFSVSAMWMPQILKRFEALYPAISVRLAEGGNSDMGRMLADRSVDLCLCAEPAPGTPCDWTPLHKDRMVAWLPASHPRAHDRSFPIHALESEPFIHTSPGHDTDQDRLIAAEGLHLDVRYTTRDGFSTYNMVEAGLGVSFNQRLISQKWHGNVAEVPLLPARHVSLGLATPASTTPSPSAERFVSCVKDVLPELAKTP